MIWQVEGNHPEPLGHRRIVQQMAVLSAIGAGRMEAQQRDSLASFLDIDAMLGAVDADAEKSSDHRLKFRHWALPSHAGCSSCDAGRGRSALLPAHRPQARTLVPASA